MSADRTFACRACSAQTHWLEEFPGRICFDCYTKTQAQAPMPTADQIVSMWGGPTTRRG